MNLCTNVAKMVMVIAVSGVCQFAYGAEETGNEEMSALVSQARDIAMVFQSRLKQELTSAMGAGGPMKAVEVCYRRAPQIAEEIHQQTGWEISRTSLKTRNQNNIPNGLERRILEQFEALQASGEDSAGLEWWQQDKEGFAYMKAIPMNALCAGCHGTTITPALKQHIDQFYPHDMATGFAVGDIRGAFTMKYNETTQ